MGIVSKAAEEFKAGARTGSGFISDASTTVSDAARAFGTRALGDGEDGAAFEPMLSSVKAYAKVANHLGKSPDYMVKGGTAAYRGGKHAVEAGGHAIEKSGKAAAAAGRQARFAISHPDLAAAHVRGQAADGARAVARTARHVATAPARGAKSAARSVKHAALRPVNATVHGFQRVQAAARFGRAFGVRGTASHVGKAGMRAGAKGATRVGKAASRGIKSSAVGMVKTVGRTAVRAAGAVAGAVAKSVLAPIGLVMGILIMVVALVPGSISSAMAGILGMAEQQATTTAVAMADDYPWRGPNLAGHVNAINPATNYAYGNCTDFAFWRVNRDRMLREGTDAQKELVARVVSGSWTWADAMGTAWGFPYTWATLTPGSGNGAEWGLPDRMPGWEKVSAAEFAMTGDILSIKAGTHGHHRLYGHVAYVAQVDQNAGTVTTENYGGGTYYQRTYPFSEFNASLRDGSFVVRHDPANTGAVPASMPIAGGDPNAQANTPEGAKAYAAAKIGEYGWDSAQYACLVTLWEHESGWRYDADNPYSDALGIPQGMTNLYPEVASERYRIDGNYQIDWGFGYIKNRYGSPCAAWAHWQNPPNQAAWGHWY